MADLTDTYYASEGFQGYGAQLLVAVDGDADTEATVAVAEVTTITPGSIDTEDVVRTHLRSPDAHHEHMPGIRDSGAIELVGTLRLDHESQNNSPGPPGGLIYLQRTRAIRNFAIQLPDEDESTLPVRGYVQRFQLGAIGVTGLATFTAAIMPTESYSADLPGMAATGATAGSPGSFTPSGASAPATLAAMIAAGVVASPLTLWTTGQHVILADASHAHWNGTTWVVGNAP